MPDEKEGGAPEDRVVGGELSADEAKRSTVIRDVANSATTPNPHAKDPTAISSSTDLPRTEHGRVRKARERSSPPSIESLGAFLRAVYSGRPKRLSPKKSEVMAMRSASRLGTTERDELLALAESDRCLDRTKELLLFSMERSEGLVLSGLVRDFVRDVFRRHPAWSAEPLIALLDRSEAMDSDSDLVRTVVSQSYDALPWSQGLPALGKKEAEACRVNTLSCLLLWLRASRRLSLEGVQDHLQSCIWEPAADRYKAEAQRLRQLMSARDPGAIGIAVSVLDKQLSDQRHRTVVALGAKERASQRAEAAESARVELAAVLEATKANVARLYSELERERKTHEDEMAHARADLEELRGRVLRRLGEELSLLDEGLHALRRPDPKVHVMVDHAERAIGGLKREMERLRGEA